MNSLRETKQHFYIFDILRVILILLVINLHIRIITYGSVNFFEQFTWYAVPLFIVLSFFLGSKYFLTEKLSWKFVLVRSKRLLAPLFFWSVMGFLVHPNLFSFQNFSLQIFTGQVVNVPLYYLNLLFLFTLLFWGLTIFSLSKRLIIYLSLFILVFLLEYSSINYTFFAKQIFPIAKTYGRFIELLPFPIIGILFAVLNKRKKMFLVIVFILSTLLFFISYAWSKPSDFHYSGITLILGSIFIFSLSLLLSPLIGKNIVTKLFSLLGKYTFGVYLLHFILLEYILKIFPFLIKLLSLYPVNAFICFTSLCYILCMLTDRITLQKLSFLFQ